MKRIVVPAMLASHMMGIDQVHVTVGKKLTFEEVARVKGHIHRPLKQLGRGCIIPAVS